ncbi:MAG: peptidoglycan-associated lipoprotein Pal [Rhodospirillales bacterium]
MRLKFLSIFVAVALLGACAQTPDESATSASDGASKDTMSKDSMKKMKKKRGPAVTPGTGADFIASVGDRIFFDYDRNSLKPISKRTLERQAVWLKKYSSVKITVEGHADERGTREYNLALGERRANSAKDYLVALGISASRIRVISYGEERPEAVGSNKGAWSQNRRAVTALSGAAS